MSQLPLENYSTSKAAKSGIGSKAQELIKAAEDFKKKRQEEIKDDIKHYSKNEDKTSNLAKFKIQTFTSGLKDMVGSFLSYKANEYLGQLLNGKFGALNSTDMFGNLLSRFNSSQTAMSAMFLDNNSILYDFIDYSRAHLKREQARRLNTQIE